GGPGSWRTPRWLGGHKSRRSTIPGWHSGRGGAGCRVRLHAVPEQRFSALRALRVAAATARGRVNVSNPGNHLWMYAADVAGLVTQEFGIYFIQIASHWS